VGVEETIGGGGEFVRSGGTLDALPMPLGSLSTRGLAGPNGTPLIGELPAPADPAGGVSCPYAGASTAKLPSSRAITRAKQRDIESFRAKRLKHAAKIGARGRFCEHSAPVGLQ